MKSVSIALILVIAAATAAVAVAAISQTKDANLPKLIALRYQEAGLCVSCKMFFDEIISMIVQVFDWFQQEMEELCIDHFDGNSTAIDVCKTKVDTMVTTLRSFVEIESSKTLCEKIYLC
ncbi:unnamed protein product [Onchocerca ochengi]|uniref:Saposin B-type domain-containing protein n=2 Tax=Onchocerca TaxID=6281 RepID=A0A182E190_ONCOC|nr:unnamed protein product [Onchocerca ochengi]